MIREFRDFVAKGDVIMLAVGFIMGVAFSALVTSLVQDLIMPVLAIPFGEPNFSDLVVEVNGSVIEYGSFLTALTIFFLTAVGVFLFIVKPYNLWAERRGDADEVSGPSELELLVEIRDALVDEKRN
ncbi:MAG: large conductance mechanosensitive channel protein MscL [Acidimicrobiia bacterium]